MMISIYIAYNIVKDWGKKYQTETGFVGKRLLILGNRTKHAKLSMKDCHFHKVPIHRFFSH